jgi:Arc/MetJ-type ribon-helix-helix transcriptional regulator
MIRAFGERLFVGRQVHDSDRAEPVQSVVRLVKRGSTLEGMSTTAQHLSLRLSSDDARLIDQLRSSLGTSKSELVKMALRLLAEKTVKEQPLDAFALGKPLFGRYGSEQRQSADMKKIVRQRLAAKHTTSTV